MDIELIKRMMDACYQGKRIRDMLPPLPDGVASSYIQYLDIIEKLEKQGIQVKVSDVSDALSTSRCNSYSEGHGSQRLCEKVCLS